MDKTPQIVAIEQSSVTARGPRHRTTIPVKIFRKMNLEDKSELKWTLLDDGKVIVEKITGNGNNDAK
jgi:ribosomal silencing factor RsfS